MNDFIKEHPVIVIIGIVVISKTILKVSKNKNKRERIKNKKK